jgi:hypothetical protein
MQIPNTTFWRRLVLYFCLGAGVIIISHFIFSFFGFLHTDIDSARYMLSALVQSEATIVALVVTLSLVAAQLTASSYSARVIEVFRSMPDLRILMGIYGFAIFYGLIVLKLTEKVNPQLCNKDFICLSNLEGYIALSYYLGVFAFVALWPYFLETFEMLKPSAVINMLAEKITKQSLISAAKEEVEEITDGKQEIIFSGRGSTEKGSLLPIIDILNSSMMKYDYETLRIGLKVIKDRIKHIFETETFDTDEERKVSRLIFYILDRVGEVAASKKDESSILEVITTIQKIGIIFIMKEISRATFLLEKQQRKENPKQHYRQYLQLKQSKNL